MRARITAWRRTLYAGLWALQELGRFPREIRLMIAHYLTWEDAYCWLCLRQMRIPICKPALGAYMLYDHNDAKPICGCASAYRRPVRARPYNEVPRGIAATFEYDFVSTRLGRAMFIAGLAGESAVGPEHALSPEDLARAWRWLAALVGNREPAMPFNVTWQQREATQLMVTAPLQRQLNDNAQARTRIIAEERERDREARHVNRKGKRK